jgi:hypothetical protein
MKKVIRSLILTIVVALVLSQAALAASLVLPTVERTSLATALNTDVSSGKLKIYSGAYDTGTLLVSLTLPASGSNSVANGVLTFGAITQQNATQDGTAAYFKIFKSDDATEVCHGDVGTSGATINLNTTSIVSGGPVSITSASLTVPAGS